MCDLRKHFFVFSVILLLPVLTAGCGIEITSGYKTPTVKQYSPPPPLPYKTIISQRGAVKTPKLVLAGEEVYLLWSDDSSGNPEIYIAKYNGENISTPKQLTNDLADSLDPTAVYLESKKSLLVMWIDNRFGKKALHYSLVPLELLNNETLTSLADLPQPAILFCGCEECERPNLAAFNAEGGLNVVVQLCHLSLFKFNGNILIKSVDNKAARNFALSSSNLVIAEKQSSNLVSYRISFDDYKIVVGERNPIETTHNWEKNISLVYEPQNNVFGFFWLHTGHAQSVLTFRRLSVSGQPSGDRVNVAGVECGYHCDLVVNYGVAAGGGKFAAVYIYRWENKNSQDVFSFYFKEISAAGRETKIEKIMSTVSQDSVPSIIYKNGEWWAVWNSSHSGSWNIYGWKSKN